MRPLEFTDLLRLSAGEGIPRVGVPSPKRLRAVHHRAAEMVAAGFRIRDIAERTGLTPQRITQLQESPDFAELVAYFADQYTETTIEIRQRISERTFDVGEMAVDEMHRRLEAEPEKIGIAELRQIAAFALDRTELPPKPAQAVVVPTMHVTFKVGKELTPKTIEGEAKEIEDSSEDKE